MAVAGKMVQYTYKEFQLWKSHEATNLTETNESAFACMQHKWAEAYVDLCQIKAQAAKLQETDLEL